MIIYHSERIAHRNVLQSFLSFYRKKQELNKIVSSPNVIEGIKLLKKYNLDEYLEINLDNTLKSLGSMQDDELRAREQLDEIRDLLKQCKLKIRSYKLPIIVNNYFV